MSHDRIGDVQLAQGDLAGGADQLPGLASTSQSVWPQPIPATPAGSATCRCRTTRSATCRWRRAIWPAALTSYQASLAISERLATADPGNAGWQRDLSVVARQYRRRAGRAGRSGGGADQLPGLASRSQSVWPQADPGNAGWQRDLSVSHNKIGDVQVAQGDLPAALTSYQASLAISERLAAADPGNAGWQRDLSVVARQDRQRAAGAGDLAGGADQLPGFPRTC